MSDRHREKPLSLRIGAERQQVEEAAERDGVPVRQWILAAIRERLEPSPCHCLCGVSHKDEPGICTGDAETTISRWAPAATSAGIPVCSPCSAAIVSAAGR